MNSRHLIPAFISCIVLLSSCTKAEAPLATHSTEFETADAEDFTVEAPASLEAQHGSAHSNPLRARPSQAPTKPLAGRGWHTPTEAQFVKGEALDVPLIGRAFQGRWSETVQQLKTDAVADPDATELTRIYEKYIRFTIGQFDGLRLKEFACGITLCAGTISSGDQSTYKQWHKSILSMNQPPVFSFVDMEVHAPNSTEHRFAFSSDETVPGLSGKR